MNKNIILELLIRNTDKNKRDYSEEDIALLNSIKETISEMKVARALFESVSDPKLVELAIYAEDVAKTRYDYLLSVAKRRELKRIE